MWQLRRMLRADPVAMVYDLQNSPRTHFYCRYLFGPVAWSGTAPGCSHPHPSPQTSFGTDRLVAQLEAAGVPAVHAPRPHLTWLADDAAPQLEAAGVESPYVVLVAGSSARNQGKRWCHYHALAAALLERGYTPITVPGPDELTTDHVLPGVRVLHEGRPLNLSQLAGVLHNAAAVIGNDSGPTHLGAFLDTPGIALFGERTSHAKPSLEAAGFRVLERSRLKNIPVDEVLEAFDSLSLDEGMPQNQVEAS
jgi:ADP-heptose:LPS heptosyltransferase